MKGNANIFIVIPAYNESSRIEFVINALQALGFDQLIVVDDGSHDSTPELASNAGAIVLVHPFNLGAGAATLTGIEFALERKADWIVTLDADGQHAAEDVISLIRTAKETQADVVVGTRFLKGMGQAPISRIVFNRIANGLTWMLSGQYCRDSQSGLKCIHSSFAKKIKFRFSHFEFCTELFQIISREKATFTEIPVQTIYTKESLRKGQNFWNGLRMAYRLFMSQF